MFVTCLAPRVRARYLRLAVAGCMVLALLGLPGAAAAADTTAPTVPTNVGEGALATSTNERDFSNSQTSIFLDWSPSTDAVGMSSYDYCITTSSTGSDCTGTAERAWTSIGSTATSFSVTGLSMTVGTRYFSCVRARDTTGNNSAGSCSDGFRIDQTDPVNPTVRNDVLAVGGADIEYRNAANDSQLIGEWNAATDQATATITGRVESYDWCVTTSSAINGTANCTSGVGSGTGLTVTNHTLVLALTNGTTYYFCVKTRDEAGNIADFWSCSNGVTADTQLPGDATPRNDVNAVGGADITYRNSSTSLIGDWGAATDTGGAVASYSWCIATSTQAGFSSCSPFAAGASGSVGAAVTDYTYTNLLGGLTNGQIYFFCLRTVDRAGNQSSSWQCTNGVTIDTSAPGNPGAVNDVNSIGGADVDYRSTTVTLIGDWTAASDSASPIASYGWCISSTTVAAGAACTAFQAGASGSVTGSVTDHTYTSGTNLAAGPFYFCVRAVDSVGLSAVDWTCSDGVRVDRAAPGIPAPLDGTGADITSQTRTTSLNANWPDPGDTGVSGIAGYDWCFTTDATTSCGAGLVSTAGTGAGRTASRTLTLTVGQIYHFCARSRDNAGNVSIYGCSNGVTVVATSITVSYDGYNSSGAGPTASTAGFGLIAHNVVSYSEVRVGVNTNSDGGYTLSVRDPDTVNGALRLGTTATNIPWNTSGTVSSPQPVTGAGMAMSVFGGLQTPARWCAAACTSTSDADLRWAALTGTTQEVSSLNGPTGGDTNRLVFRVNASNPSAGSYSGVVEVTVVPAP